MRQYRKYHWPDIFSAFEQSGLTQADFCKQHNINPKYFSLKWARYKREKSGFTPVVVESTQFVTHGVVLEVGQCKIHCPATMSTESLATLIRSLA